MDESTLRFNLSTAKSHLAILQTLLRFDEYEGDSGHLLVKIESQQSKVNSLEKKLRQLTSKEDTVVSKGRQLKNAFQRLKDGGM